MPLNRPDIEELTRAVRQWLDEELRPTLHDPAQHYKARVASSVLTIVERQLRQGERRAQEEQQLLQGFLGEAGAPETLNAILVEKIQRGELDASSPGLLELLHRVSLAKMAIDNPRYSTFKKYQSQT